MRDEKPVGCCAKPGQYPAKLGAPPTRPEFVATRPDQLQHRPYPSESSFRKIRTRAVPGFGVIDNPNPPSQNPTFSTTVYCNCYEYYSNVYYELGQSNSWDDTYPPNLSSISVSGSSVRGGSGALSLYGDGLTKSSSYPVLLISGNGVSSAITFAQPYYPWQVNANFSISSNASTGSRVVRIQTYWGTSNPMQFTVGDPTPVISSVDPDPWTAGTSTIFTIHGSGFGSNPGGSITGNGVLGYGSFTALTDTLISGTVWLDDSATGPLTVYVQSNGWGGNAFVPAQQNGGQSQPGAQRNVGTTCGPGGGTDVRDTMRQEYPTYLVVDVTAGGTPWTPRCGWFTHTAQSGYYSFNQLGNIGKQPYSWALVKKPLTVDPGYNYGLSYWTVLMNLQGYPITQTINSAFRPPAYDVTCCDHQNQFRGGRHRFGDAIDLNNASGTAYEHDVKGCLASRLGAQNFGNVASCATLGITVDAGAFYVEPLNSGGCFYNCIHADWRYTDNNIYSQ